MAQKGRQKSCILLDTFSVGKSSFAHTCTSRAFTFPKKGTDSNKQEEGAVCTKKLTETNKDKGVKGGRANLAHEGLVGVAELAQVQQGLHHRLLQSCLCLLICVLVPVDVAP